MASFVVPAAISYMLFYLHCIIYTVVFLFLWVLLYLVSCIKLVWFEYVFRKWVLENLLMCRLGEVDAWLVQP